MSITVVIMSYKYGHLISQSIDSVLSQTCPPDEVIVIDDGAGDCKHVPHLYSDVTFCERPNNLGQVKSFQEALGMVTTDRFMMLGADNWLRLDALEKTSSKITDIVSYDLIIVGTERNTFSEKLCECSKSDDGTYYWNRFNKHHGSMLINTKIGKSIGYGSYISIDGNICEDRYIYDGMMNNGATYSHIHEGLLFYRRHKDNFNES
jgi:glycosyltransferase involved in cell wall biosynthesis